ncbi:MAG: glycosyltransferase family 39 protein [Anaerolineales bacterium]|jgi:4-amino-4-deoxy-L-arabinose transferase-like glycosyltransferase
MIISFLVLFLIFFAGMINLESAPPLWWDEGWNLTLARNWVERGYYGQYLEGQPQPPGLSAAFPAIAPIALSFRVLGVGVWQGRLPGVLFAFGSLGLLFYLSTSLYNRSIAWAALFAVLLLLTLPSLNPILNGRQVLADMPMMFYLLAGYACILAAWRRPLIFLPICCLFWGIAIIAKAQTFPFWLVSLGIPVLLALLQRRWKTAILLLTGIGGSWYLSKVLLELQGYILRGHTLAGSAPSGLVEAVALVPLLNVRVRALIVLGVSGLPTLFGLIYITWQYIKQPDQFRLTEGGQVVRLALYVLAGSWLGWFILLCNSGPRYLAAPGFVGGIFVAVMLHDLTGGFDFRSTILRAAAMLKLRKFDRRGIAAISAIILGIPMAFVTLITCYPLIFSIDNSVVEVTRFLNAQTQMNALVETYDSELFFFLERPYHYPPQDTVVPLLRRYMFEQDFEIDYDPLQADPDYLVVGPTSAAWRVYDPVLESDAFRLIKETSRYFVYERVR